MSEKFRPGGGRSEHCRIGERRDFITEISPRNDSAGNPPSFESLCLSYSEQGHADGGDGCPRAPGNDGNDGADETARCQEYLRCERVLPVVYERGNYATEHPCAGNGSDE